ncbi:unnamed protein product [Meganyctiphanes norvegica]|uniref:Uncharacterized protein n=1 Tax=Meganyctiphanes norvegica TaxID=48144 RepID=A0AAV2RDE3_MEGNR
MSCCKCQAHQRPQPRAMSPTCEQCCDSWCIGTQVKIVADHPYPRVGLKGHSGTSSNISSSNSCCFSNSGSDRDQATATAIDLHQRPFGIFSGRSYINSNISSRRDGAQVSSATPDHRRSPLGKYASLLPLALQVELCQRLDEGASLHLLASHYCLPLRAVLDLRRYCLRVLLSQVTKRRHARVDVKRKKPVPQGRPFSSRMIFSGQDRHMDTLYVHRKLGYLDYAERNGYLPLNCETGPSALRDLR